MHTNWLGAGISFRESRSWAESDVFDLFDNNVLLKNRREKIDFISKLLDNIATGHV